MERGELGLCSAKIWSGLIDIGDFDIGDLNDISAQGAPFSLAAERPGKRRALSANTSLTPNQTILSEKILFPTAIINPVTNCYGA